MVIVPNATIRHQGLLVDNTTKIQVYFPELTAQQDQELIMHTKYKEAAVIILEPHILEPIMDILNQAMRIKDHGPDDPLEDIEEKPDSEPSDEEWTPDEETGFDTR